MTDLVCAHYRCRDCGEQFPLLVHEQVLALPAVVGGVTTFPFMEHGPGCRCQVWERIDAPAP